MFTVIFSPKNVFYKEIIKITIVLKTIARGYCHIIQNLTTVLQGNCPVSFQPSSNMFHIRNDKKILSISTIYFCQNKIKWMLPV